MDPYREVIEVGKLTSPANVLSGGGATPEREENNLLRLICDIRFAIGDSGKRMWPELIEYCRELLKDKARLDWALEHAYVIKDDHIHPDREAIDAAMKEEE